MKTNGEQGIALVLSLFLIAAMSVIAASLMLLSQTETYSSMNYRLMSQARYGAESGVHMATNYILYAYPATAPGTASDPITNYDITKSPVLCVAGCPALNQPVILSANANQPSNYPVATVQADFAVKAAGALPAGNTSVAFAPYAKLISMQRVNVYGGGQQTIQTWQIVSTGTITQGKTAQAEVSAIVETPKFPASMYAAFATSATCGALDFHGQNTKTDSYDSSVTLPPGAAPTIGQFGGDVGTNGNLSEGGGADIHGMLSSPRVGIGACSDGNVDALSTSGGATVNGHSPPTTADIIHLPAAVSLPAVTVPTGVPTGNVSGNGQTWDNTSCAPCSFGDVMVNATSTLTLGKVGDVTTINVNSIKLSGNAQIKILGTVILNVVGAGDNSPIELLGNGFANMDPQYDPSTFQIQYAGTGAVKFTGGSHSVAMIYAPNAAIESSGNADFYGSVVGATVNDTGGMKIHYDRHLSSAFFVVGNAMMSSFSWKKY